MITDERLDDLLRATLTARAAGVTTAPPVPPVPAAAPRRPRVPRRVWAPLAAVAVVLAVAALVVALRPGRTAVQPGFRPVPAGTKPFDAYGVELFVPASWSDANPCGGQLSVDGVDLTQPVSCTTAGALIDRLQISSSGQAQASSSGQAASCASPIVLDGEAACPVDESRTDGVGVSGWLVAWPAHRVTITTATADQASLAILRTAAWVPVDRAGCPVAIPARDDLTAATDGGAVCWYSGGRLAASARLGTADARAVLGEVRAPDHRLVSPLACLDAVPAQVAVVDPTTGAAAVSESVECGGLAALAGIVSRLTGIPTTVLIGAAG